MKSFRPMVYVQGEWAGNALRFATEQEAVDSARDLMQRWTLVEDYRADPSEDAVNYSYIDRKLVRLIPAGVKSRCICGHTGDTDPSGNASEHDGLIGHGACKVCSCPKFTWREFIL